MAEAQSSKDRLRDITNSIEDGIKNLFQSDKYAQYLRTMSRFHKYSVNNTMLIFMQKPDATLCAGFNKWRDQFGRNVIKGEKGIKIIAPTPFKRKIEETKLDPDTKLPVLDADGKVVTEEKEVKIPMYKVTSVFDVTQTLGKPLPTLAADLAGNVRNYDVFMDALKRSAPVPISFAPLAANMDGCFDAEQQSISLREGMSEVQTVSAAVHEIAHSKLHNKELPEVKDQWKVVMVSDGGTKKDLTGGFDTRTEAEAEAESREWKFTDENEFEWHLEVEEDTSIAEFVKKSRNTEEVEAESVSFAVCAYYGIATGENSFGYIASWSKGKDLPELRSSLETINQTASGLITDIDSNYTEIMKERGLDKEPVTQETERPEPEIGGMEESDPKYEYKLHANPCSTGIDDAAFIQAYQKTDAGLIPCAIIGYGAYDRLISLTNALNDAKKTPDEAKSLFDESTETSSPEVQEPEHDVEKAPKKAAPENGYFPDSSVSVESMNAYGYTDADMLPLSKARALELAARDVTVYMLYENNTEAMAFDTEEIQSFGGIFGITREDWEAVREQTPQEKGKETEQAFLGNPKDAFAIYQLSDSPDNAERRFMGTDYLSKKGLEIEHERYCAVYTGDLAGAGDTQDRLNEIYTKFNIDRPEDFTGHSLSVSDIIALKQAGVVSCHYVDSWGFKELPAFMKPENYLKNAEMAMEDDYGMIDGIVNNGPKQQTAAEFEQQAKSGQSISLLEYVEAVRRENTEITPVKDTSEPEKKPSVLAKLKSPISPVKTTKTAPVKSAERELL